MRKCTNVKYISGFRVPIIQEAIHIMAAFFLLNPKISGHCDTAANFCFEALLVL